MSLERRRRPGDRDRLVAMPPHDLAPASFSGHALELREQRAVVQHRRRVDVPVGGDDERGRALPVPRDEPCDHAARDERHVRQHHDRRPGAFRNVGDSGPQRPVDPLGVVGIDDRHARQSRELRAGALPFVAHDNDDWIETGADRAAHDPSQQRLAVELEEQLVSSHARRAAGGKHDAGHRAAAFSRHG